MEGLKTSGMKTAYTIVTANYLAQAKAVADSFIAHNTDYRFVICLLDKVDARFDVAEFQPHEVLEVEDLQIPYFVEMYTRYSMFELSNAMKPFFAEYLYKRRADLNILIYLDSDMIVFDSFKFVEEVLAESAICFTPHVLTTIPKDDFLPNESGFLNSGIYNGGFFALSIVDEAKRFIEWWKEKLRHYCFHKVCEGLFVDQIWLNLVPLYFDKVHILKHPGFNVAYYNLHERRVSKVDDKFYVNDQYKLALFHYTGYDLAEPELISKYQNRFNFQYRSDIKPLYDFYRRRLIENKHDFYAALNPFYKKLKDTEAARQEQKQQEKEQERIKELTELISNKVDQALPEMVNNAIERQTLYGTLIRIKRRYLK